ncbi:MAG: hypothetical protein OYH77_08715 [Pseudomonadota bacterium]|nr:hypothetical protein [Pseudomonadota bacterium]
MFKHILLASVLLVAIVSELSELAATPPTSLALKARIKYRLDDLRRRTSDWVWRLGIEDFFYRTCGGRPEYDEVFQRKAGNYYISSSQAYYVRSYRRGRAEKDPMYDLDLAESRQVLAEPSLVGFGVFSMLQESDYFGTYESDQSHHVFAAKIHEDTVTLGIVDGLRTGHDAKHKHLSEFSSEWITGMFKAELGRKSKSLYAATLGIPSKLDWQVNRHVRGRRDHASLGEYHPERPLPNYAGAFVVGAEISKDTLSVTHIGNGRLLLVRDDSIIWQTTDDNITYHLTSGVDYASNPNFRALRLPAVMNKDLSEVVHHHALDLQSGDRIILASDSVWAVCTSEEILTWTRGLDNADATSQAREQIKNKIATANANALNDGGKINDDKFAIIIYDHIL